MQMSGNVVSHGLGTRAICSFRQVMSSCHGQPTTVDADRPISGAEPVLCYSMICGLSITKSEVAESQQRRNGEQRMKEANNSTTSEEEE
eukprot:560814-Pleurochrysis_carterae.AAC.1